MHVCVFCGSSPGTGNAYIEAARQVGRVLAERGIGLVYGGAGVGTMGELADAALAAGGSVVGVIPQSLVDWEVAHGGLTEQHVVTNLHERKALMAHLSDAFIALPGGAGTLDELFETWTWAQLGLHAKPVGLLDVKGYFQPMIQFLDHMVTEGFLKPPYREMLIIESEIGALLDRYAAYEPPSYKWTRGDDNRIP